MNKYIKHKDKRKFKKLKVKSQCFKVMFKKNQLSFLANKKIKN